MNYTYMTFYNFILLEQNNKLYIVDELENFYYDSQDFDNCLENMTNKIKNIVKDQELYLECEIRGRYEIVSDVLDKILEKQHKKNIEKGIRI